MFRKLIFMLVFISPCYGAEFLIKKADNIHPNPIEDARASYKKGDIVEVFVDGTCVNPPSPYGAFYIIKVPGVVVNLDHARPIMSGGTMITRRRYKIDLDSLPQSVKDDLADDGMATLQPGDLVSVFVDKTQ